MDIIKKLRYLRLFCYISAVTIILLVFYYSKVSPKEEMALEAYCGVVDTDEFKNESTKEGRKLFKILCASCHKLDKDFIGPALGGITERRDSTSLYAYIINQDSLIDSFRHEFNQLTKEQIDSILDYTTY